MTDWQPFPPPLARVFAASANRVLALDADVKTLAADLEQKILRVQLAGPDWVLTVRFSQGRLEVLDYDRDAQADTTITGSPFALLGMAIPGGEAASGKVRIEGDVATGSQLQQFLKHLDPDWDAALAQVVGDVGAHHLGRLIRSGLQGLKKGADQLAQDSVAFVREEARLTPHPIEVEDHTRDLEDLRDDIARLEAAIARLEQQRE